MDKRPLTDQELYEGIYVHALAALERRGQKVGKSYTSEDQRFCDVEGIPRRDRAIFELAWGNDAADDLCRLLEGEPD
jgi:hypothetical protein